ncbi:hypothetical protein M409DRAFT_50585 [Zasmidium cellare ATCC 36951]|uniref:Uncharacterized protein n=1 Tax=Zasmidium cellare ATCC 36951 TaxID=1080233 RepID=A0A6A6D0J8_ZASCE|nr:uncharacterized protein M409DRAFT_50585 [Zasmidium cellare ATCC 36951]KAF2171980.1 hypothetical protein M409DRAFT_50585 [Zasmidium cellare ATCC 36951]
MNHSNNDDAFASSSTRITSSKSFVPGSNLDAAAVPSSRLQKQRSNAGMRSASHGQPFSSAGQSIAAMRGDGSSVSGFGDGAKARKGSIRNAVKKIFGRRGREVVSQGPDTGSHPPASRHTYHKSEPTGLPPPREDPEPFIQDTNLIERTFADPYQAAPSPPFHRTSSPYAMQFPNSVRLKPMDLGNPFIAPPNQLRRRKTLPSLLLEEREESAADVPPRESTDIAQASDPARETPTPLPKRTTSQVKKARRKSRSTDDLKSSSTIEQATPRKKSKEIRHLRESFQPDVLRASGFTTRYRPREEEPEEQPNIVQRRSPRGFQGEEDATQEIRSGDAYQNQTGPGSALLRSSPPGQYGHRPSPSFGDVRLSSGAGTEMSKDLEDRVAKLEAGLQNFQNSLQRLTAERNRRTIIMGSVNTRRSSNDMRTPSLLADTLADPLEPSSYEYEYGHTIRPSTSPQPPPPAPAQTQGSLEDPFGPDLPRPSASARQSIPPPAQTAPPPARGSTAGTSQPDRSPENFPMPLQSHPPTQHAPAPSSSTVGTATALSTRTTPTQPQPYTFSSLYQMLSDERSARRKLENQLKSLQREISDLHTQVSINTTASSAVHSTRSSYMLAGSSTRLQELLRETEEAGSPPRSAHARDSGAGAGMISRFSGSESEAGVGGAGEYGYEDSLATPYEAYRTPREGRSAYSLVGGGGAGSRVDAEMF